MAAGSVTIPPGTYGPGTTIIGPRSVGGTLSKATASFDITQHTSPAITLEVLLEYSADGGPWRGMAGFRRVGSPISNGPDGKPITNAFISIGYPPMPNRQIRCTVTITGGSIVSSGVVNWQ
jgi:hypothetical protein